MDSTRSNEEWSASEINIVRSLITRYNDNNSYINDINKKHSDIVNEVQEMFPWKEKHQVVCLYVDLVEEMVRSNTGGGSQHSTVVSRDHVSNNTETSVGHPAMENMDMGLGHPTMETRAVRVVHEVPRRQNTPRTERSHPRFWTKAEHRLFLRGLQVFGRGNWKNISKFCVTTRTPLQVSSHAQKYFRRLENAANRQRYSINDVGLYDNEPLAPGREGFTFANGANNPNRYGVSGQHAILNSLAQVQRPILNHAYQANSSHANAWPGNQQLGATSSSSTHVMEGVGGSQAAWASDQLGDFFPDQMINLDIF